MKHTMKEVHKLINPHWPRREGQDKVDIRDAWPMIEVGEGWADVLYHGHRIAEDDNPDYVVHQIKEKFGTLRFYANVSIEAETMIENLSLNVCEICGAIGQLSSRIKTGWLRTLCKAHRDDVGYRTMWELESDEPEQASRSNDFNFTVPKENSEV